MRRTVRGIPLETWVYHQELDAGIATFEEPARRAIEFYSDYIGPYPLRKAGQRRGGRLQRRHGARHGHLLRRTSRYAAARPTSLVAHEIAHQWFGDSVTESDWDDVWLSEGFATYFAPAHAEHYQGREAFVAGLKRSRERSSIWRSETRRWPWCTTTCPTWAACWIS